MDNDSCKLLVEGEGQEMIFCELCVGEAGACCEFCLHYKIKFGKNGVYAGNRQCTKHDMQKDPEDVCDDFHCREEKGGEE